MKGGKNVNTIITSREAILDKSRLLIREQGWTAVNIRSVANVCGVSIGSIYNYFHSKSDLVSATVESVWYEIFHVSEQKIVFESFLDCIQWIFDRMKKGEEKYPGFFTLHAMSFLGEDKVDGQHLMAQSWEHMQKELYFVLIHDKNIGESVFNEDFTAKKFVEIIFSLILSALLQHNYDCSAILEMIRRTIYK